MDSGRLGQPSRAQALSLSTVTKASTVLPEQFRLPPAGLAPAGGQQHPQLKFKSGSLPAGAVRGTGLGNIA